MLDQKLITFPVSPEASRLGTYGAVPVSLYSGLLQKSINLFSTTVGDYPLSLDLSYNYSGFKVEESPSIVGLGWQMNIGGVVTREVRGLPDEHRFGYYGNTILRENVLAGYFANGTMSAQYARKIADGVMDSEADRYRLSVNGISFSFKIGLDGTPAFLSKHNYRLQINRNPAYPLKITSFVLTDTDANSYLFDQIETNSNVTGNTSLFDDDFPNYASSWQLSKITLNNGSVIDYTYQDDILYTYNYYAIGVLRPQIPNLPATSYDHGGTKDQINRKLLKSVTGENFKVSFDIGTENSQKVYKKITVRDANSKIVSDYDFLYSSVRNKLDRINRNNQFFYEFVYSGTISQGFMNSALQMPWSQDAWGYANGANNQYGITMPGTSYTTNRAPSFVHTVTGALTRITYPTGGRTDISYEQNTVKELNPAPADANPNMRMHLKFKSDNTVGAPQLKEKYYRKTFATDVVATLNTTVNAHVQAFIELMINKVPPSGPVPIEFNTTQHFHNRLPVLRNAGDPIPPLIPKLYDALDDGCTVDLCTLSRTSNGKFIIPAGTYEFKFRANYNQYATKKSDVTVTLDYHDLAVADSTRAVTNRLVGGIRVRQTVDTPVIGSPVTTNYGYNDDDGASLGGLQGELISRVSMTERLCWMVGSSIQCAQGNVVQYTAKPATLMNIHGSPVSYSGVKHYTEKEEVFKDLGARWPCNCTGDLGANFDGSKQVQYLGYGPFGYTQTKYPRGYRTKSYAGSRRYPSNDYPFPPQGDDLSNGVEIGSGVYGPTKANYMQDTLVDQTTEYRFSNATTWQSVYTNPNYPKSLKMGFKIKASGPIPNPIALNQEYAISTYAEFDSESLPVKNRTKEYFGVTAVENTTDITYNSYEQQKTITTSNSTNDVMVKEISYPHDFTNAVSLDMVAKNVLSKPVRIVTTKNGVAIESSKYDYTALSTNLFKPSAYLKGRSGTALETRTKYQYDDRGNVTFLKDIYVDPPSVPGSQDEPSTVVIWGYNKSLPIAKIQMAPYTSIAASTIASLQAASNIDIDPASETALRTALNALRTTHPDAMVTTYTHDPLVGVTSMTDPKGDTIFYKYDVMGRLIEVRDADNHILSKNDYHYKQ